ncbi:hypothetical protein P153DRAFT_387099 [Dothidotthia symphoricarpi CBS 119687]|uniref:Uncharacterized protein n=1 Tax=Dothidotthia symphoricarpi CBS 119687 TaxID=1392245 RepID=A0A6A6ABQ6_9PLEO|nr:uncharacterized protein P153DRAFT_387099 [Dothidotthia symphoricarpi CBS 119687]KAF2128141.1 hypothetical protein P153DRAFT_387099 [Dothidotthia symphoricarpi CBS 119687]
MYDILSPWLSAIYSIRSRFLLVGGGTQFDFWGQYPHHKPLVSTRTSMLTLMLPAREVSTGGFRRLKLSQVVITQRVARARTHANSILNLALRSATKSMGQRIISLSLELSRNIAFLQTCCQIYRETSGVQCGWNTFRLAVLDDGMALQKLGPVKLHNLFDMPHHILRHIFVEIFRSHRVTYNLNSVATIGFESNVLRLYRLIKDVIQTDMVLRNCPLRLLLKPRFRGTNFSELKKLRNFRRNPPTIVGQSYTKSTSLLPDVMISLLGFVQQKTRLPKFTPVEFQLRNTENVERLEVDFTATTLGEIVERSFLFLSDVYLDIAES